MQSVSSRIWTRVAVYISYDDNQYTTGSQGLYIDRGYVYMDLAFTPTYEKSMFGYIMKYFLGAWS